MNPFVPEYLLDTPFGAQVIQHAYSTDFQESEANCWKLLPFSAFLGCRDGDDASKSKEWSEEAQEFSEKVSNSTFSGTNGEKPANSTTQKAGNNHKVGAKIPLIQERERFSKVSIPPPPSQWNHKEKSAGLEISSNGLCVTYAGELGLEQQENSSRSVRANRHIPPECGIFYFEISIVNMGRDRQSIIGIGLSCSNVFLNRLPGWEEGSWGYHGDDGNCFCNSGSGKAYGPTYAAGDVIGCIVNYIEKTISFTKNGINLGVAFHNILENQKFGTFLHPTVGLQTPGEVIDANFGQSEFVFDIKRYFRNQKAKLWDTIMNSPFVLNPSESNTLYSSDTISQIQPKFESDEMSTTIKKLIITYLVHNCFLDTAKYFYGYMFNRLPTAERLDYSPNRSESEKFNDKYLYPEIPPLDLDGLKTLKAICNMIVIGDIDGAISEIEIKYPNFLEKNRNIDFALRCGKYIEMVRHVNEVFDSGKKNLSKEPDDGKSSLSQGNSSTEKIKCFEDVELSPEEFRALGQVIECGQKIYEKFHRETNAQVKSALIKVFSLISYPKIEYCPSKYLLDPKHREVIAEAVDKAILVYQGKSSTSGLEIVYRHTSAILEKLSQSLLNVHKRLSGMNLTNTS